MEKDRIYLHEIEEFCRKVIAFTTGISEQDFAADENRLQVYEHRMSYRHPMFVEANVGHSAVSV